MNSIQTQMLIAERALLTDGTSLADTLDSITYSKLGRFCEEINFPIEILHPLKPVFAMLTLLTITLQNKGITKEGVDEHFYNRALKDNKEITSFETVVQQIDYLVSLDQGHPDAFVQHSIEDLRDAWYSDSLKESIDAWHQGNEPVLYERFVAKQKREFPELYQTLVVSRNHNWMPAIEAYLQSPETEFVLVGIAHLMGEDGIVSLLRASGYQVDRVDTSGTIQSMNRRSPPDTAFAGFGLESSTSN